MSTLDRCDPTHIEQKGLEAFLCDFMRAFNKTHSKQFGLGASGVDKDRLIVPVLTKTQISYSVRQWMKVDFSILCEN